MKTFTPPVLDDDLLFDVIDEVTVLCEESAATLTMLGREPDNRELLDKLFRSIHTIKGRYRYGAYLAFIAPVGAVEDILAMMREGTLEYNSVISDLLLIILDQVKSFICECEEVGYVEYDPGMYLLATQVIAKVRPDNIGEHDALLTKSLLILEPSLADDSENELLVQEFDDLNINWANEVEPDLVFFHSIMKPVEERVDHWEGRSSRQLKLALLLNQFAGKPVDEQQLRVAVYLHDIGMSLLPLAVLRKTAPLSELEVGRVRGHVQRGVSFLSEMPHWSEASRFIHEHHERVDGQGYPRGLSHDEISHGGKILALVDAFEAMTHERAKQRHKKRPIAHALREINHVSGSQFCPYWVGVLNQVMASMLAE